MVLPKAIRGGGKKIKSTIYSIFVFYFELNTCHATKRSSGRNVKRGVLHIALCLKHRQETEVGLPKEQSFHD